MPETIGKAADTCWVITDGKAGNRAQAIGLAEAAGLPFVEKTVSCRFPWNRLPAAYWPPGLFGLDRDKSDPLDPPWPRLTISCGGRAVGPALAVKRAGGGRVAAVHIQHPRVPPGRFDLIAAPVHDRLSGPNVVATQGAVHRVSEARLAEARSAHAGLFDHLPRPLIAVLIGGENRAFVMSPETTRRLCEDLLRLVREQGAGLAVTASRRTGADNEKTLRAALAGPAVDFWNGEGENPYFAMLALADAIVVTGDSVNMISEACSSGKPVYVAPLDIKPGRERAAGKFMRFQDDLAEAGATLPFEGPFDPARRTARLRETEKVAEAVRALLQASSS